MCREGRRGRARGLGTSDGSLGIRTAAGPPYLWPIGYAYYSLRTKLQLYMVLCKSAPCGRPAACLHGRALGTLPCWQTEVLPPNATAAPPPHLEVGHPAHHEAVGPRAHYSLQARCIIDVAACVIWVLEANCRVGRGRGTGRGHQAAPAQPSSRISTPVPRGSA